MLFINSAPFQKKGRSIYTHTIAPLFEAAKCDLEVICSCPLLHLYSYLSHITLDTSRRQHAFEIAQSMDLKYDAVVSVSGDGLVHEILNGFARHERSGDAFAIPVVPLPTGSGNGLSMNLLASVSPLHAPCYCLKPPGRF